MKYLGNTPTPRAYNTFNSGGGTGDNGIKLSFGNTPCLSVSVNFSIGWSSADAKIHWNGKGTMREDHFIITHKIEGFHSGSLHLTHWGQDKMAAIFHITFSNAFSWMKMYEPRLRFHWSLFLRVQFPLKFQLFLRVPLTISNHWSR